MEDTTPEMRRRHADLTRQLTPEQRFAAISALTFGVRRMAEAGIRRRYPDASDQEVRVRLCVRLYGPETARRLFGSVPDDAV